MNEQERELRRRLGVVDDSSSVVIFEQSAHCDWDWNLTHDGYFTTGVQGENSVIDILSAGVTAASRSTEPDMYVFCEVGYLRDFLAAIEPYPGTGATTLPTAEQWHAAVDRGRFAFSSGGVTSAENLLVHPEAFIRNYLLGRTWVVNTFGVQPSLQLWVPDDFGHDAQLPALAQAMGFVGVAFWRIPAEQLGGFASAPYPSAPVQVWVDQASYTAAAAASSPAVFLAPGPPAATGTLSSVDFVWQSRDGSAVQAHWLYGSYLQGDQAFGSDPQLADIQQLISSYQNLAPAGYLFVPIDGDFSMPYVDLPAVLSEWNASGPACLAVQATFDDFVALVHARDEETHCLPRLSSNPTDQGPVYLPHPYWSGCYATAPATKRLHHRAVNLLLEAEALEIVLEYLGSLNAFWALRASAARSALTSAWELVVPSTHHDYITGTSPNAVRDGEQIPLLERANRAAEDVRGEVQQAIASAVVEVAGPGTPVVLFNPVALARDGLVEISVPDAASFTASTIDGTAWTPVQPITDDRLLTLASLPPMGYRTARVASHAPTTTPSVAVEQTGASVTVSNSLLRAVISANGIDELYDLHSDTPARNLFEGVTPGNAPMYFSDSGTIYRFGSEQLSDTMTFAPLDTELQNPTITIDERGPIRVSVSTSVDVTFPPGTTTAAVSLSCTYRLVAGEPFLRIETTGAAPALDVLGSGCSVMIGFPFGRTGPISELAYGTTAHWDRRSPRSNFLRWDPTPPPTIQDVTFEPTHGFVLPLGAAGAQLGAVYHQSTPAWAISDDGQTLLGCVFRNAPNGGQGAQGDDTGTHTQSYAVRVPSGLATPDTGVGPRTPLGEALLLDRPATGVPLPTAGASVLPDELSIATTTDTAAVLSAAKMGTVDPEQLILRLYQPTDQALADVRVRLHPLIAGLFGRDGRLDAAPVTALELPPADSNRAGLLVTADTQTLRLPMPTAYATLALPRGPA